MSTRAAQLTTISEEVKKYLNKKYSGLTLHFKQSMDSRYLNKKGDAVVVRRDYDVDKNNKIIAAFFTVHEYLFENDAILVLWTPKRINSTDNDVVIINGKYAGLTLMRFQKGYKLYKKLG